MGEEGVEGEVELEISVRDDGRGDTVSWVRREVVEGRLVGGKGMKSSKMGSVEVLGSFGGRAVMYPFTVEDSQSLTISFARANCLSRADRTGEWSKSMRVFERSAIIWNLGDKRVSIDSTRTNHLLNKFFAILCRTTQKTLP